MAQQINLYDPALRPRHEGWRAVHGLWAMAGTVAVMAIGAAALDTWAGRREAQAAQLEQLATLERPRLGADPAASGVPGPALAAELERLRQLEAGQRRVQQALQAQTSGQAVGPAAGPGTGQGAGYLGYLHALSRQAQPTLWITGLTLSEADHAIEIQGRMTDASVLPDYLRRLNQEPQFKGRQFAQLRLRVAEAGPDGAAATGHTEFVLRSQPGGAEPAR